MTSQDLAREAYGDVHERSTFMPLTGSRLGPGRPSDPDTPAPSAGSAQHLVAPPRLGAMSGRTTREAEPSLRQLPGKLLPQWGIRYSNSPLSACGRPGEAVVKNRARGLVGELQPDPPGVGAGCCHDLGELRSTWRAEIRGVSWRGAWPAWPRLKEGTPGGQRSAGAYDPGAPALARPSSRVRTITARSSCVNGLARNGAPGSSSPP
jgi:hypothetical protein